MSLFVGIRTKLLLAILLLLVISFSILLYTTIVSVDSFVARQIDTELAERLRYLQHQFYSRGDAVRDALLRQSVSQELKIKVQNVDRIWLSETLDQWRAILPYIDFINVVDVNKRVLARTNKEAVSDTFAVPVLLDEAFRGKKAIISTELLTCKALDCEISQSQLLTRPCKDAAMVVTVVVPLVGEGGKVIGALVAGDLLNGDSHLADEYGILFGKEGHIALTQLGYTIISSHKDIQNTTQLDPVILSHLASGQTYLGDVKVGNQIHRTTFFPILDIKGVFIGSLSVGLDVKGYRLIRQESERNIIAAAVVAILLSFGIAFFVSRQLAEPLRRLARGVRMIEAGDLNQQVEVVSSDEVGQLAHSFNSMASTLTERNKTIEAKTEALQELNDLLERKVEERTIRLQLQMGMQEAILTCMVEGMVVTDSENRVIQFNPAAQKFFDIVPHRVLGYLLTDLSAYEGFADLARIVDRAGSGDGSIQQGEAIVYVKGRKLLVSLAQLLDSADVGAGVVMSLRDASTEEEVDRMKADFLSTVSHELKTPLTSIKGALQFIMNKGKWLTATERELIAVCLRNTDRLIRLINDILDISKIEAGKVAFEFTPQSVNELVMYAIEEIKGFAIGRGITVINCSTDDLPPVFGDYDRLIQVLTNLLSNAVKFSSEQKVVIVNAVLTDNYVTISVVDSGRSIQWTDRAKLFRKFQQLDRDDMGFRGGTGLGLAICKEIVEMHHGRIYYETGSSGGNVFSFTVPVYRERHEG